MSLTNAKENAALDWLYTTTYMQAFTASPEEDESNTAAAVGDRVAPTLGAAGATVAGQKETTADLVLTGIPQGTLVTHIGAWDAAAAGNVISFDELQDANGDPITVTIGSSGELRIDAGNLKFTLD